MDKKPNNNSKENSNNKSERVDFAEEINMDLDKKNNKSNNK